MLSKSLQPTFSSEVRVNPSHSPPTNVGRDTEPFFQPTSRTLDDSSTPQRTGPDFGAAQQPLATKLHTDSSASGSSSQCAGPDSTAAKQKSAGKLSQTFLLQGALPYSALAQTVLLQSRSRPVSLNQSINDPSLQQGALVQTVLLLRASRLASLTLTLTDLSVCLLKGPVLPSPTDLSLLSLPDLAHLLCRKLPEGTVFLALSQKRTVISQTGLRWNCLLRKESCLMSKNLLSMIYQPQRSRRIGKQ